jgi:hypothetical protein
MIGDFIPPDDELIELTKNIRFMLEETKFPSLRMRNIPVSEPIDFEVAL